MGLATAQTNFAPLNARRSDMGERWDSNGEAEARTPLKIYIILSSQPTIIFHFYTKAEHCKHWSCWECF